MNDLGLTKIFNFELLNRAGFVRYNRLNFWPVVNVIKLFFEEI